MNFYLALSILVAASCTALPNDAKDKFSSSKVTRQAVKEDDPDCLKRWPNGEVPYRFDFTDKPILTRHLSTIKRAVTVYEEKTCLKFEDITTKKKKWNQEHLIFQSDNIGCFAIIGRYCNKPGQMVNLDRGCKSLGLVMHEIAHGLGLFHQHVRPDRDQYVKILEENISEERLKDFEIQDVDTYGIPYDYTSMLHYGKYTGSKNGRPTIETMDPINQFVIGNTKGPSHYDYMILNKMYNCSGHCVDPPQCQNGGYVNKDCNCECPKNTKGKLCQKVTGDYYSSNRGECGEQVIETDTEIKSFKYDDVHPTNKKEIKCMWYLKAPAGKRAQVTFDRFRLYKHPKCRIDWLDIMMDLYNVDHRVCGNELKGKTITATQGSMMLVWAEHTPGWRTGFHAIVKFIDDVQNATVNALN